MTSKTSNQHLQSRSNDCLGRTCMKWSASGELSAVDRLLILERLAQVDARVTEAWAGSAGDAHN